MADTRKRHRVLGMPYSSAREDAAEGGVPVEDVVEALAGTFVQEGSQVVNAMHPAYAATGDGTTNDRTALFNADAAATAAGRALLITMTHKVDSALTFTAPVIFLFGGKIKPASGISVTFNADITAEKRQIFDISLGGRIAFAATAQRAGVHCEWWGTVGNGTVDDTAALLAAYHATLDNDLANPVTTLRVAKRPVYQGVGTFRVTAELLIASVFGFKLITAGRRQTIFKPDFTGRSLFALNGFNRSTIEGGFTVVGSGAEDLTYCLLLMWDATGSFTSSLRPKFADIEIDNVRFRDAGIQIGLPGGLGTDVSNSVWINCIGQGQWVAGDVTYYQHGIRVGNGVGGNNTLHHFFGCQERECRRSLSIWAGSCGWYGGNLQGANETDIYIDGPPSGYVHIDGVRTERGGRLLDSTGTSAGATVTISNYSWSAANGYANADGEVIRWAQGGILNLEAVQFRDANIAGYPMKIVGTPSTQATINMLGCRAEVRTLTQMLAGLTANCRANVNGWSTGIPTDPNEHVHSNRDWAIIQSSAATAYTWARQDAGVVKEFTANTAVTVTIPDNTAAPAPIGTRSTFRQAGGGQVSVVGAAGVTIDAPKGNRTLALFSTIEIEKRGTNRWVVSGEATFSTPRFVQVQKVANLPTVTGTSMAATLPATATLGNTLIAVFSAITGNSSADLTGPAGWTLVAEAAGTSNAARTQIWTKASDGTETTLTFTAANSTSLSLHVWEYSGLAGTMELSATTNSGAASVTTLAVGPSALTAGTEALAMAAIGFNASPGTLGNAWTNGFLQEASTARATAATKRLVVAETVSTMETWTTARVAAGVIAVFPAAA